MRASANSVGFPIPAGDGYRGSAPLPPLAGGKPKQEKGAIAPEKFNRPLSPPKKIKKKRVAFQFFWTLQFVHFPNI